MNSLYFAFFYKLINYMESKNNDLFSGPIRKVLWNASVIHEKRLGVLDEHIEKLLKNNDHDTGDYNKNLELLNKKIDNLESFRKEFKEYKNDIKNIKYTLSLQAFAHVSLV